MDGMAPWVFWRRVYPMGLLGKHRVFSADMVEVAAGSAGGSCCSDGMLPKA